MNLQILHVLDFNEIFAYFTHFICLQIPALVIQLIISNGVLTFDETLLISRNIVSIVGHFSVTHNCQMPYSSLNTHLHCLLPRSSAELESIFCQFLRAQQLCVVWSCVYIIYRHFIDSDILETCCELWELPSSSISAVHSKKGATGTERHLEGERENGIFANAKIFRRPPHVPQCWPVFSLCLQFRPFFVPVHPLQPNRRSCLLRG